ncbi:hypothetical protein QYE76_048343 [Lolium multiflorum]|uniref:Integrase catalytic domain-containing protein n=1 Tax=Lolium multiflorum TaxID=4521 RepID=A0AAD8QIF7_LOLMU|nr:hypothetical protein QYE76_048343 [Lolium multiflorum]
MQPPTTKKELQRLMVRSILSDDSSPTCRTNRAIYGTGEDKTKSDDEFYWGAEQQAFDEIKRYLTTPPMLVRPSKTSRSTSTYRGRHVHCPRGGATHEGAKGSFSPQQKDADSETRTLEGLLLKCLGPTESNRLLHEVHEGACGTHQSAQKMKWLIQRSGFYWPTMLEDCFNYYKGCQACQMYGKIQMVPASAMNPIIKPWPFRGWGMDMIGKIHPPSSKNHEWILAITDYFTKWVEAVPMKKVKSEDVIQFVKEHVIHRFGIPQTITTDGGSVFVSKEFRKFYDDMGIKLIRSSPYYAQANGQAEASNQSLIKLIKRKIEENPRGWHETLSEALWAYRMSCHGAIKTSPHQLVYGQEAVLPWEITAGSRRVTFLE